MLQLNFQRLQPDVSQPVGLGYGVQRFWWLLPAGRVSGAALLMLLILFSAPPDNAWAASGQPFVIHETFEQHPTATPPVNKASHGVVGLDLLIQQGHYPLVQGVFRGMPAANQGLLPGDMILAINGVTTFGKNVSQVDTMISDVPGDRLLLTVQRGARLSQVPLTVAALEELSPSLRSDFSYLFSNNP